MEKKEKTLYLKVAASFLVVFAVLTGLGLFQFDSNQALAAENCTRTSGAAFFACWNEAWDDAWIAAGNCSNLSELDDQAECMLDVIEDLQSAREDCSDQFDARKEICESLGEEPYDPQLVPEDFVDPDDIGAGVSANQYFPLVPGTVWVYEGDSEEGTETVTVTVTEDIRGIEYPAGSGLIFMCRAVRDVVELNGEVIEDTEDWFAQDMEGNVWYFDEISQEFEDGELVGIEGSWKAGRDSAKPGIVMLADPQEGQFYRQEFFLGDAEDVAEVVSRGDETVDVPFGPPFTDDVLQTRDFTPIEPDVIEFKYYAPGVGLVLEVNPDTGERVELVGKTEP